jgi:hypothetical protein
MTHNEPMARERLAVGGAVLSVLLVAGGAAAVQGVADRARSEGPPPPATLSVSCAPDGITVSGPVVAAGASGVTLEVASTMPPGSSLAYGAQGYGGGEPLPSSPQRWVRALPPGDLELTCSTQGSARPEMRTRVEIVDPGRHWREATLGDAGCTMTGGQPSWAIGAVRRSTPREAVDALLAQMSAASGQAYDAHDAGIGYPLAATQTWVALKPDGSGFTVAVTHTGTGYEAGPDYLCGGTGKLAG